jgi:hypothetical protein
MQLYKGMACYNKIMIKKRKNILWYGENRKVKILPHQFA